MADSLIPGLEEEQIGDIERQHAKRGVRYVVGVDEAGRGPLAGPVSIGAVLVDLTDVAWCDGLDDSKKLSEARRDQLAGVVRKNVVAWHVVHMTPAEIDELNILAASLEGMRRAVEGLKDAVAPELAPQHVLVDGNKPIPGLPLPQSAIVKGDGRCWSIAAGSILAKTTRDAIMRDACQRYPGYGFSAHKGYPTRMHLAALREQGPCEIHRRSFRPVREVL